MVIFLKMVREPCPHCHEDTLVADGAVIEKDGRLIDAYSCTTCARYFKNIAHGQDVKLEEYEPIW